MQYTLSIIIFSLFLAGSVWAQPPVKSLFNPQEVSDSITALTHLLSDTTSSENTDGAPDMDKMNPLLLIQPRKMYAAVGPDVAPAWEIGKRLIK